LPDTGIVAGDDMLIVNAESGESTACSVVAEMLLQALRTS
jgi:hypothetical protein